MDNSREEVKELQIGLKIRRLRQNKRLTLQQLSEATGLSKPLLSQIENGQVIPPLATLLRISKALKIGLHSFFQEEGSEEKCVLVKADARRKLRRQSSSAEYAPPYTYHSLSYGKRNKHMEPFLVEFENVSWREDMLVRHEGEEFLFLLEGELELHYGDKLYKLCAGDSIYYESTEPHGFSSVGSVPAKGVAVLYSPE